MKKTTVSTITMNMIKILEVVHFLCYRYMIGNMLSIHAKGNSEDALESMVRIRVLQGKNISVCCVV